MTPKALRSEDPPRPQQPRRAYIDSPADTPRNMVSMCRKVLNGEVCPNGADCHWRHEDTDAEDVRARAARKAARQRPTAAACPAPGPRTVRFSDQCLDRAVCSQPGLVRTNRFAPLDVDYGDMPPLVPATAAVAGGRCM